MAVLVIAEHNNQTLSDATAKTVTAAAAISTPVHVLVAGEDCAAVAEAAAKIAGRRKSAAGRQPALCPDAGRDDGDADPVGGGQI